jgi:hypothetical protein
MEACLRQASIKHYPTLELFERTLQNFERLTLLKRQALVRVVKTDKYPFSKTRQPLARFTKPQTFANLHIQTSPKQKQKQV